MGRFDSNFVESRRAALEKMLNKTASHPTLQHDADLKLFLESETFNVDIKHKERRDPLPTESKGVLGSLGINVGSSNKFVEQDDWFHDRKVYLDALEVQLKGLLKAMDSMVGQRKMMAEAAGDFSASLHALSTVELSPTLSGPLDALSDLQLTIQDVYDRQAQQDVLTFGIIIEEYIRLISSVKQAFTQRQKGFYAWQTADNELQKKKGTQDKLLRQGKSQQDRLNQMNAEVGEAERKVHQARLLFEDMGRSMRAELDRFEREKVEDFKSGVETFLEGAVEAQKEVSQPIDSPQDVQCTSHMLTFIFSLSRSGRRFSCSWMRKMTSRPSTSRPCTSHSPSPRVTRLLIEQGPAAPTKIQTRALVTAWSSRRRKERGMWSWAGMQVEE